MVHDSEPRSMAQIRQSRPDSGVEFASASQEMAQFPGNGSNSREWLKFQGWWQVVHDSEPRSIERWRGTGLEMKDAEVKEVRS